MEQELLFYCEYIILLLYILYTVYGYKNFLRFVFR